MIDAGVINFAIYENGSEYLGVAKITFPDMSNKKLTVNGAGIPGDVDLPVPGHRDAMTCTIEFLDAPEAAYKLAETRVHLLDCRVAHENYNPTAAKIGVTGYKHVLEVIPTKLGSGSVAPSAAQAASGEYSCISRKDYIDGKLVLDYEPLNFKDVDASGTDHLAEVRKALGK